MQQRSGPARFSAEAPAGAERLEVRLLKVLGAMAAGGAVAAGLVLYTGEWRGAGHSFWSRLMPSGERRAPAGRADIHLLRNLAHEAGKIYGVPPELVWAVIVVESRADQHAVSHRGAQGLMQLMPATAGELGVRDPFDPRQNIYGGTKYLKHLLERYEGNIPLALAAYNAGPTKVRRYRGIPPYRETRQYVQRVLKEFEREKAKHAPVTNL